MEANQQLTDVHVHINTSPQYNDWGQGYLLKSNRNSIQLKSLYNFTKINAFHHQHYYGFPGWGDMQSLTNHTVTDWLPGCSYYAIIIALPTNIIYMRVQAMQEDRQQNPQSHNYNFHNNINQFSFHFHTQIGKITQPPTTSWNWSTTTPTNMTSVADETIIPRFFTQWIIWSFKFSSFSNGIINGGPLTKLHRLSRTLTRNNNRRRSYNMIKFTMFLSL